MYYIFNKYAREIFYYSISYSNFSEAIPNFKRTARKIVTLRTMNTGIWCLTKLFGVIYNIPVLQNKSSEGAVVLRGIPECIDSELLKILYDMGHGDTIVLADHFYPAVSKTPTGRVVQAKGVGSVEMIEAILKLMPLDDEYCNKPFLHIVPDADSGVDVDIPELWVKAEQALVNAGYSADCIGTVERSRFYDEGMKAYATVSTSETQTYGCFILQKGVK